jgi:hypothetical protein
MALDPDHAPGEAGAGIGTYRVGARHLAASSLQKPRPCPFLPCPPAARGSAQLLARIVGNAVYRRRDGRRQTAFVIQSVIERK